MAQVTGTSSIVGWRARRRLADPLQLDDQPTLVIVPHPDDEVLACGGTISALTARGIRVEVLAVTDGEASHSGVDPARLAARRRGEQRVALRLLGVTPHQIRRLGMNDGRVAESERALTSIIADLASDFGRIIAPWVHDHHCDHEAVGRAALAACRRTGTTLLGSLVWGWHRSRPSRLHEDRLGYVQLDDAALDLRRQALAAHGSQHAVDVDGGPVLTGTVLRSQRWDREYFICS